MSEEQKSSARETWTYDFNKSNSVWPELDKVLTAEYQVVGDAPRKMKILATSIDTGYCEKQAFDYVDKCEGKTLIWGIKGSSENKAKPLDRVTANFKRAQTKRNLYILDGNSMKDELSSKMRLRWNEMAQEIQPTGFMNFPTFGVEREMHAATVVLYQFDNYFSHFEAEHRIEDLDNGGQAVGFVWKKKDATVQNHMWDCRLYAESARDIFVDEYFRGFHIKNYTWQDFVNHLKK